MYSTQFSRHNIETSTALHVKLRGSVRFFFGGGGGGGVTGDSFRPWRLKVQNVTISNFSKNKSHAFFPSTMSNILPIFQKKTRTQLYNNTLKRYCIYVFLNQTIFHFFLSIGHVNSYSSNCNVLLFSGLHWFYIVYYRHLSYRSRNKEHSRKENKQNNSRQSR